MAFKYWNNLSDTQRSEIVMQAKERHDACGRIRCFWCGEALTNYDFTSDARDPREICKGFCRGRRYFDNPKGYEENI